jgi:hypothetical protein
MGKTISLKSGHAEINFSDFCLRIFTKRKGLYYNEIRIWKLPIKHRLLAMLNIKNLIWAIYNDDVKILQGWLHQDNQDFLKAITSRLEKCNDYEDLKKTLINFEEVIKGGIPWNDPIFDEIR